MDEAVRLADQTPSRDGHRYPLHAHRGHILTELDRLDEARSALDTGRRISDDLGRGWHLPSYQMVRTAERFVAGEWDDAITEVEASVELAHETGQAFGLILDRSVLSLISLHRNDLNRRQGGGLGRRGPARETGAHYRAQWAAWARALVLEAEGKSPEALLTLTSRWDRRADARLALEYRMLGPDLVRLALRAGDRSRARTAAAAVTALADDSNPDVPSMAAPRCAARDWPRMTRRYCVPLSRPIPWARDHSSWPRPVKMLHRARPARGRRPGARTPRPGRRDLRAARRRA